MTLCIGPNKKSFLINSVFPINSVKITYSDMAYINEMITDIINCLS